MQHTPEPDGWYALPAPYTGYDVHPDGRVRSWRARGRAHGKRTLEPRDLVVAFGSVGITDDARQQRRVKVATLLAAVGLEAPPELAVDAPPERVVVPHEGWLPIPRWRGYEVHPDGIVRSWRTNSGRRSQTTKVLAQGREGWVQLPGGNHRQVADLLELAQEGEPRPAPEWGDTPDILVEAFCRLECHLEMVDDTMRGLGRTLDQLAAAQVELAGRVEALRRPVEVDLAPVLERIGEIFPLLAEAGPPSSPRPGRSKPGDFAMMEERAQMRREVAVIVSALGVAAAADLLGVGPGPLGRMARGEASTCGGLGVDAVHTAYVAVRASDLEDSEAYEAASEAVSQAARRRRRRTLDGAAVSLAGAA